MKTNRLVIITFFLIIISSCRYEEGPLLDFSCVKNRLEGIWELEYLYVGGIDSTWYAKNITCNPKMRIIYAEDTRSFGYMYPGPGGESINCDYFGSWTLLKHKSNFYIVVKHGPNNKYQPVGPYLKKAKLTWNITRLTDEQLWMNITDNNVFTWAHFIKVKPW